MRRVTENIIGLWVLLTCFVIALGVTGCTDTGNGKAYGRHAIVTLMDSAEAVMNDDPQYALQLMDSIDSDAIRSRALNARYALLYTESQYKCFIPVLSDSLIMIAVRYYSVSNQSNQLFRSFYSLGCIYYELGQLSDAAVALSEAEGLADNINDGYRLGLLNSQLGIVFRESFDYQRAESFFIKAYNYYKESGKEKHQAYELYEVASCKMGEHDFRTADSVMMEVEKIALANGDKYLYSKSLIGRFSCSLYMNTVDSASAIKDRYVSVFGVFEPDPFSLGLLSYFNIQKGYYDDAQLLLNKAWNNNPTIKDSINLYYYSSILAEKLGKRDSALYYYQKSMTLQNTNLGKVLRQPILAAQRDHFQTIAQIESLKNKQSRVIILSVAIVSILIILLFITYHRFHVKQIEQELEDNKSIIDELKRLDYLNNEKIDKLTVEISKQGSELTASRTVLSEMIKAKNKHTDTIEELRKEVFFQNRERYGISDHLYTIYYDSKDNTSAARQQLSMLVKALKEEYLKPENLNRLDKMINESNNNVINRIKDTIPLKDKELQIIRFSFAKLSLKAISVIIDEKTDNVYQLKSRLLKKIKDSSENLWQEIHNML